MSIEVRAQNTISLTSVKAIKDATDKSAELLAEMEDYAEQAGTTLTGIYQDAEDAKAGAEDAKESANSAQQSANTALVNLGTIQKVLEVVEWVAVHGVYSKTTDTAINPNKTYYTVQATTVTTPTNDDITTYYELVNGAYVKTTDTSVVSGKTYYYVLGVPVGTPVVADISTYYELAIDEAMANYIMTHLALTDDGLYVISDASAYKLLLASDGMYIEAPNGNIVNQSTANGNVIRATNGTVIANLGYGEGIAQGGSTATAPYYTFGTRASGDIGNWSVVEGTNNLGSRATSHTEGENNTNNGYTTHTEGYGNSIYGLYTHVEGTQNTIQSNANSTCDHIEGSAHTLRMGAETGCSYNHVSGIGHDVAGTKANTVIGRYATTAGGASYEDPYGDYAFKVGNGTSASARSDALTVDWSGNVNIANGAKYKINGANLSASDVDALPLSGGTMTGQIKTSFKSAVAMGSYQASATTVDGLADELRLSSGCVGSANITTAYTKDNITVSTKWYNFFYVPHRSGGINGVASGDNCNYGHLTLYAMTGTAVEIFDIWLNGNNGAISKLSKHYTSADRYTRSSAGTLDWTSTADGDSKVIMKSALAFWNGAYSGTSSTLKYSANGEIIGTNTAKVKTTFTPTSGSSYSSYGGCYYETYGKMVHVHVGVSGLTANTGTTIFTLPSAVRPSSVIFGHGTGGTATNIGYLEVRTNGVVYVYSNGSTYVGADVTYMV